MQSFAAADPMVHYVYCGERFVNPNGEGIVRALMKDGLHPDAPGLEILSRCLAPLVAKYAGAAAGPGPNPDAAGALQPPPLAAGVLNLAGMAGNVSSGAGLRVSQATGAPDGAGDGAALAGSAAPAPILEPGVSADVLKGSPAPEPALPGGLAAAPRAEPAADWGPAAPLRGHSMASGGRE